MGATQGPAHKPSAPCPSQAFLGLLPALLLVWASCSRGSWASSPSLACPSPVGRLGAPLQADPGDLVLPMQGEEVRAQHTRALEPTTPGGGLGLSLLGAFCMLPSRKSQLEQAWGAQTWQKQGRELVANHGPTWSGKAKARGVSEKPPLPLRGLNMRCECS